eukprot:Plantae.Rhodophyta-Rhodochaete_pulchella.ctg57338.p3 GENE.Plantae.Rhodophyta-Rhodochaete_pulchella.ctg57338~~Plantae.Rhodophyta-Rhodochaete_pulchella.ctg57338.p3  ORF type:complete len:132 (-),score=7.72 Plantae.Rhodophyta-Rhodochaete_pulchella.ctg57338:385-780(-)
MFSPHCEFTLNRPRVTSWAVSESFGSPSSFLSVGLNVLAIMVAATLHNFEIDPRDAAQSTLFQCNENETQSEKYADRAFATSWRQGRKAAPEGEDGPARGRRSDSLKSHTRLRLTEPVERMRLSRAGLQKQ